MRDLTTFASALRSLAEGSPKREASCPLGGGLRITVKHEDTVTGERVFTLSATRHHTAPQPEDLALIAEAFSVPSGTEWKRKGRPQGEGYYHTAQCRWHERKCADAEPAA